MSFPIAVKHFFRAPVLLVLAVFLTVTWTRALHAQGGAPVITRAGFHRPAHAHVGEPIVIEATGLATPLQVFFSDGTNPTIEADVTGTPVDVGRGWVVIRVPTGARNGYMKLTANGVDSSLFYFRVDSESFTPGTNLLEGEVTHETGGMVPGVLLLLQPACHPNGEITDFTVTASDGSFTLHGGTGTYQILAAAPLEMKLANSHPSVVLPNPQPLGIQLAAGTGVTGTVVDDQMHAVPNARVIFKDGDHEEILSDGAGHFTALLQSGNWKVEVEPPPGSALQPPQKLHLVVSGAPQDLNNLILLSGVRVSGTVTSATDGSFLSGADVSAGAANRGNVRIFTRVLGDGKFVLALTQNASYTLAAQFDSDSSLADVLSDSFDVQTSPVTMDLVAHDAAFISGTVSDRDSATPIACETVIASTSQDTFLSRVDQTITGTDGRYRLRVPPAACPQGYLVGTLGPRDPGDPKHAPQTWTGTGDGTYFPCEGATVLATTAGATTQNIDFMLPVAVAFTGNLSSKAGGCSDSILDGSAFQVDDGKCHGCGMGVVDFQGPGYKITLLPPSSVVPNLRACVFDANASYAPQCYNMRMPPSFDPISIPVGPDRSGIDFCLDACSAQNCPVGCGPPSTTTTLVTCTTRTVPTTTTTSTTTVPPTTTTTLPCTTPRCTIDAGLRSPVCTAIPASVTNKFNQAASLIDQAATSPAKKAKKLLKKAKTALKGAKVNAARAAKGKKRKISSDCAAALKRAADDALAGLGV